MMTAEDLARLLNSGADGIDVVESVMPPDACDALIEILRLLKTGQMAAPKTWNVDLEKVIGILANLRDANSSGDLRRMATSLRRFSERRRILGIIGRFIR